MNEEEKISSSSEMRLPKRDIISCSFSSCEKIYNAKSNVSNLKSSNLFNICLVVSGSGIHQVLDQEIPCSKGDICIIPPNVPYDYFLLDKKDNLAVWTIAFDIFDWFSGDMSVIGEKFKNNEVYVPEVLVAARAMNMGAQILKPHLAANGVVATGKVCIGTVP